MQLLNNLQWNMSESSKSIYRFLRLWRKNAGLTQEQVANILGISNTVLSEKERGVRKFKPEEVEKLVEVYGEEAWVMMAFAPGDPRLEQFKRAMALIRQMSPASADKWLGFGEAILHPKD
jgi:transcriptional regulator with XRE-family HTH domain